MAWEVRVSFSEADVFRALPPDGFLKKYVEYATKCTDAHASYHIASGAVALAQTVPIDLHVPFGTPIHGNVFGLAVGASSTSRKSSSINVMRDILAAAVPSGVGEQPGSREALVDMLRVNARQAIIYGEFGSFLANAEKSYFTPIKTAYTECYDNAPLSRALVRTGRNTDSTVEPRLSLIAGSTLEYLERHTEPVDWTGGFMARFLTFFADRERTYTVPPGDPTGRKTCIEHLKGLLEGFVSRGQCLGFDAQARKLWDDWYVSATNSAAHPSIQGMVARAPMHGLRLALLFAWDYGQVRSGSHWYLTERELAPARAIVDLHIESVLRIAANLAPNREMRERRDVYRLVGERPTPLGQIVGQNSGLPKAKAMAYIETLLEEGLITKAVVPGRRGAWFKRTSKAEQEKEFSLPPETVPENVFYFPGFGPGAGNDGGSNASSPAATSVPAAAAAAGGASHISTGGVVGGDVIATTLVGDRVVPVLSPPTVVFTPVEGVSPTEPLTWGTASADDDDDEPGNPVPPPGDPISF